MMMILLLPKSLKNSLEISFANWWCFGASKLFRSCFWIRFWIGAPMQVPSLKKFQCKFRLCFAWWVHWVVVVVFVVLFCFWNWISFGRHPFGRLWKKLVALGGPKYKARGFEHLLSKFFDDDLYLDSTLTSVLIPAFDIKLQQPVFFSSWKVKKKSHPLPSPTPNPS